MTAGRPHDPGTNRSPEKVPEVSVVMGVFNGVQTLARTLDSVLAQDVDLELIVVDDGSDDGAGALLDEYAARDGRVRVLHQPNLGLTRALQAGCALACAEFIARQDAGGDISLPGRLRRQLDLLRGRPDAVFASCGLRNCSADGDGLGVEVLTEEQIQRGLHTLEIPGLRGPCHPTTMFRRASFERVGGYRAAFVVAQDIDLWLRLIELGPCVATPEILYEFRQAVGSISSSRRAEQLALAEIAMDSARARRAGVPEPELPTPSMRDSTSTSKREELARFHYFVGSCLRRSNRAKARDHFRKALKAQPTDLRTWWRVLTT